MKECWFAYFPAPFLLPSDYGIPCKLLPTLDTMYEQDITVPPVVHGPVLISFADLNGFEFGSKLRNPYQKLFERQPDDVIANGVAGFEGDFTLPEAAALQYEQRSRALLSNNPPAALRAARQAVALVPDGFDANMVLGDAALATGDIAVARAAYSEGLRRVPEMEPSVQKEVRPMIDAKLAALR